MAKMPARTLKALKGSIAKWEAIVAGTGTDEGVRNCPLCKLFNPFEAPFTGCLGCPVRDATGESSCNGSPYQEWSKYWDGDLGNTTSTTEERRLAKAELRFLRSLLPEDE